MQPLTSIRQMMIGLNMCPAGESTSMIRKAAYLAFTSSNLVCCVIFFTSSLTFCVKFIYNDFDGAIFALMFVIGTLGLIYISITCILMRNKIGEIFLKLSAIYNIRKFDHFDKKKVNKENQSNKISIIFDLFR